MSCITPYNERMSETGEPGTYRTKTGRILTDEDLEALADEAERGYDPESLKRRDPPGEA
jgi:hypothetical protein